VKGILDCAIERERISHAYLFYGQPGVGKNAMSIALARGLFCDIEPRGGCGSCKNCQSLLEGERPGFFPVLAAPKKPRQMSDNRYSEIVMERTKRFLQEPYRPVNFYPELTGMPLISIDQVRTMKKSVRLRTSGSSYRVFILPDAERMNQEASNSLLKLLEEPPQKTILILTSSFPGRLLKTIVSRCQQIRFDPLKDDEIAEALVQRGLTNRPHAAFLAKMSGGSLQRALACLDEEFGERRKKAVQFLEASLSDRMELRLSGITDLIALNDRSMITEVLQLMHIWMRDMLLLRSGNQGLLMNIDSIEELKRFSKKWPGIDLERGLSSVEGSIDYIQKNVYLQLVIFTLARKLYMCR
jgi:DNA polymerase-3 subunit delta'